MFYRHTYDSMQPSLCSMNICTACLSESRCQDFNSSFEDSVYRIMWFMPIYLYVDMQKSDFYSGDQDVFQTCFFVYDRRGRRLGDRGVFPQDFQP